MARDANTVGLAAHVAPSDGTLHRELDGEMVLLHLDSEMYFGLDDVGAEMWRALTCTDSVGAALDHLLEVFEADREQLETDLLELTRTLVGKGLLQVQ